MTRRVFSFDQPDRFVCGAVGQPGQRTFFLQAAKGSQVVSVALEKAQVAVLAERLAMLLLALRQGGVSVGEEPAGDTPTLSEPVVEEFRVGTMTLSWESDSGSVVIEARELTDDDEDEEDDEVTDDETAAPVVPSTDLTVRPDVVRVRLAPQEALAFATGAVAVVQAGRPACPQCGAPLDPTGHFCTRRNGYTN